MKTTTIEIHHIKDPDLWWQLAEKLGLSDEIFSEHFEFGDYAALELEVDESLRVVGGRFLPCGRRSK